MTDATATVSHVQVFRPGLLDGQVAVVTGGGTGIGLGISELLAELGAHVVIASRKPDHLNAALESITARGHKASVVQLDVRDPERVKQVITEVGDTFGRIDLLINRSVIIEVKSVEATTPTHAAQLLTYLRFSGCRLGFVMNFGTPLFKNGVRRVVT